MSKIKEEGAVFDKINDWNYYEWVFQKKWTLFALDKLRIGTKEVKEGSQFDCKLSLYNFISSKVMSLYIQSTGNYKNIGTSHMSYAWCGYTKSKCPNM